MRRWESNEYATEGKGIFGKSWFNRTSAITEASNAITEGITSVENFSTGAWNGNPDIFQNAGHDIGSVLSSVGMAAGAVGFGVISHRGFNAPKAFKTKAGSVYRELAEGGAVGRRGVSITAAEVASLRAKKGTVDGIYARRAWGKGIGRKGFIKTSGFGRMLSEGALFIGAPLLSGVIAGSILGYTGKYLDMVNQDMKSRKSMYYDNRYFDTRKYDASSYQQIGMAMNDYSNAMQSSARIYHAR